MQGIKLYSRWVSVLNQQGAAVSTYAEIDPRDQQAWNALAATVRPIRVRMSADGATAKAIYELFEQTDAKPLWYSGRGMMGRQCLGLSGDMRTCQIAISEVIKSMFDECMQAAYDTGDTGDDETFHDFVEDLMLMNFDTFGHEMIFYWPNITKPSDEEVSSLTAIPGSSDQAPS